MDRGETEHSGRAAAPSVTSAIPPEILHLLGKPPVLRHEELPAYQALMGRVAAEFHPQDFCEWMYVRDFADIAWEQQRLQRVRTALLDQEFSTVLSGFLRSQRQIDEILEQYRVALSVSEVVSAMLRGEAYAAKCVDDILARAGSTRDTLMVEVFDRAKYQLERVDALIDETERRYRLVMREAERYQMMRQQRRRSLGAANAGVTDLNPAEVVR